MTIRFFLVDFVQYTTKRHPYSKQEPLIGIF
jgi:hypothetical protein